MSMTRKTCSSCGRRRAVTEFCKDRSRKDGLEPRCRDCRKSQQTASYAKHQEARRAAKKTYNDANKESRRQKQEVYNRKNAKAIAEKMAEHRLKNPEKAREARAKYYETHHETILERGRNARKLNPWPARRRDREYKKRPEVKARERERYATDADYRDKRKAGIKRAIAKRKGATKTERVYRKVVHASGGGICYLCGDPVLLSDMHLEHRQPLSRGGSHTYDNIGCACGPCNMRKQNKTEAEYRQYLQEFGT